MIYSSALLLLLASASAVAGPPSTVPEEAAGKALMQCVAHAIGQGSITSANASTLAANGLSFNVEPPAFLASTRQTEFGSASYAQAPSTEGQVWAVGYDNGTCLVFTLGTLLLPIEGRYAALFAIPGTWQAEKAAKPELGERKRQYQWKIRDDLSVTALVSLRDLPGDAKGLSMTTISRTTSK